MTTRKPDIRAKEMYRGASGVPEPFDIAFACSVADCKIAEKKIHERLRAYRSNKKREFFIISIEVAKKVILSVCKEINQLFGYSIENPIVIDALAKKDSNLHLEEIFVEQFYANLPYEVTQFSTDRIISSSPPGTSLLTNEQKQRIEIIGEIFTDVFPGTTEDWISDFSKDVYPEREIYIWENMAKAFLKIDRVKYFSEEQKKEAFSLLLMRSMRSTSEVLKEHKLKTFSRKMAKEILGGYEYNPKPIVIIDTLNHD